MYQVEHKALDLCAVLRYQLAHAWCILICGMDV